MTQRSRILGPGVIMALLLAAGCLSEPGNDREGIPREGVAPPPVTFAEPGGFLDVVNSTHVLLQFNTTQTVSVSGTLVVALFDEIGHTYIADPCEGWNDDHRILVAGTGLSERQFDAKVWRLAAFGIGRITVGEGTPSAIQVQVPANGTAVHHVTQLVIENWEITPTLTGPQWRGSAHYGGAPWSANVSTVTEFRPDVHAVVGEIELGAPVAEGELIVRDQVQGLGCAMTTGMGALNSTIWRPILTLVTGSAWNDGLFQVEIGRTKFLTAPQAQFAVHSIHISGLEPAPQS